MYDAVVIGGGPAGSATAYHLATQGIHVAVVDKAIFPRDKACGDILSPTALRCIERMGLGALFADYTANGIWELNFGSGGSFDHSMAPRRETGEQRWAVIPRRDLDAALLAQAQKAGAVVLENVKADKICLELDHAVLAATGVEGGKITARLIIIAEGSSGRFTTPIGPTGIAIRGYYSGPQHQSPVIHWIPDLLPGGYEWQFPVTDTLYNIGIGTIQSIIQQKDVNLEDRLHHSTLIRDKEQIGRFRGGLLNYDFTFRKSVVAHADRVLRVGDAAGLVQPHLGEGIGQAMHSAEIAAEYAAAALAADRLKDADLADYTRHLRRELGGTLRFGRWVFNLMSRPRLWQAAGSLVAANYRRLESLFQLLR